MNLVAYDAVTGKTFQSWTTENEPDAGLVVIVPRHDEYGGELPPLEVCVGKIGLNAAFGRK